MEKVVMPHSWLTQTSKPTEQAKNWMRGRTFELTCKTSVCSHKLHLAPLRAGTEKTAITSFSSIGLDVIF
ncbi:MAG: hypothetical protein EOM44_05590 [Bacteroidia bacterium]|nr:hypothetical protein [Bacteroidia bacterium]